MSTDTEARELRDGLGVMLTEMGFELADGLNGDHFQVWTRVSTDMTVHRQGDGVFVETTARQGYPVATVDQTDLENVLTLALAHAHDTYSAHEPRIPTDTTHWPIKGDIWADPVGTYWSAVGQPIRLVAERCAPVQAPLTDVAAVLAEVKTLTLICRDGWPTPTTGPDVIQLTV